MKWHWELEICPRLGSSAGKESDCNAGEPGLIPGSGRSPGEGIGYPLQYSWASLVAQSVKNLLVMQETSVWFLDWEDPLEEGMAMRAWQSTPVFLPGESPWTEEPGGLQSMKSQRDGHDWATKHSTAQGLITKDSFILCERPLRSLKVVSFLYLQHFLFILKKHKKNSWGNI